MILTKIKTKVLDNKKMLIACLISTFIWGLLGHAYMFFSNAIGKDTLAEFNGADWSNMWKIQIGRVFEPLFTNIVRGGVMLPWLIGVIALFILSIAVFVMLKLFDIESVPAIVLLSGVFTVNTSITGIVSGYLHDFDAYMFSLLCSVAAVYLWKNAKFGYLWGMLLVCISLGIYQSYISVTITLIMLISVLQLASDGVVKDVFFKLLKGAFMVVGGGTLYWISIKVVCAATGIELVSDMYNSLSKMVESFSHIGELIVTGYIDTIKMFLAQTTSYPYYLGIMINAAFFAIVTVMFIRIIIKRRIAWQNVLFLSFVLMFLPLSLNISHILANGMSYDLMHYAFTTMYLFAFAILFEAKKEGFFEKRSVMYYCKLIAVFLVMVFLHGSLQLANRTHLRMRLDADSTEAYMNRVLYALEASEEYIPGETEVVFIGRPDFCLSVLDGFDETYRVSGGSNLYIISTERHNYEAYFKYVIRNPIKLVELDKWLEFEYGEDPENYREILEMPSFPDKDCIKIVDNVMVVKLGDFIF